MKVPLLERKFILGQRNERKMIIGKCDKKVTKLLKLNFERKLNYNLFESKSLKKGECSMEREADVNFLFKKIYIGTDS